jgi:hypothetical protein
VRKTIARLGRTPAPVREAGAAQLPPSLPRGRCWRSGTAPAGPGPCGGNVSCPSRRAAACTLWRTGGGSAASRGPDSGAITGKCGRPAQLWFQPAPIATEKWRRTRSPVHPFAEPSPDVWASVELLNGGPGGVLVWPARLLRALLPAVQGAHVTRRVRPLFPPEQPPFPLGRREGYREDFCLTRSRGAGQSRVQGGGVLARESLRPSEPDAGRPPGGSPSCGGKGEAIVAADRSRHRAWPGTGAQGTPPAV